MAEIMAKLSIVTDQSHKIGLYLQEYTKDLKSIFV